MDGRTKAILDKTFQTKNPDKTPGQKPPRTKTKPPCEDICLYTRMYY